jgi:hypothetical protein
MWEASLHTHKHTHTHTDTDTDTDTHHQHAGRFIGKGKALARANLAGGQAGDEVGKETMRCRRSTPTKRAVAASEAAYTSCTIPPVLSHRLTPRPPLSPPSSLLLSPPRSLRVERHAQLVKIQAPNVFRTVRRNALRVSTVRDINRQMGRGPHGGIRAREGDTSALLSACERPRGRGC